ncbi:MAG: hypothetical protein FWG52_10160 [Proteobacteria bacterium]|nr:hypothetical protein [Pseudomonadota bacterium]
MTKKDALKLLQELQHWRRCSEPECGCEHPSTDKVGEAIDVAINALKRATVAKLDVHESAGSASVSRR